MLLDYWPLETTVTVGRITVTAGTPRVWEAFPMEAAWTRAERRHPKTWSTAEPVRAQKAAEAEIRAAGPTGSGTRTGPPTGLTGAAEASTEAWSEEPVTVESP